MGSLGNATNKSISQQLSAVEEKSGDQSLGRDFNYPFITGFSQDWLFQAYNGKLQGTLKADRYLSYNLQESMQRYKSLTLQWSDPR